MRDTTELQFQKYRIQQIKHVVDCMKLGVVQVVDEDCTLLEIGETSGDESWQVKSDKCKEYFFNNLTAAKMAAKL